VHSYLVGVETPEVELLLEERAADVGGVVQLAGAVVVEDLREDARMSVEEVLVEYRVVVGERLGEPRQARRRDLLERRLVRLVADAAHVEHHAILGVRHHRRRHHRDVTPHRACAVDYFRSDGRRQANERLNGAQRRDEWFIVCRQNTHASADDKAQQRVFIKRIARDNTRANQQSVCH